MILNRKLYGNFKLPLNIFKSICFYSLYKEHTSGTLGESLQLMIFLTSRSSLKSYRKLIFVKSLYLDFKNSIANYLTDKETRSTFENSNSKLDMPRDWLLASRRIFAHFSYIRRRVHNIQWHVNRELYY